MTSSESVKFLAAGDLHVGAPSNDRLGALFDAVHSHADAAFFAVPGDLTNESMPWEWVALKEMIARLPVPFLGCMGNHDFHTGPDDAARGRFTDALGVEAATFTCEIDGATFIFLSTDGDIDGCTVDIRQSLPLLEETLAVAAGPVVAFCHAPLAGTVGSALGRECFLSDDPMFGLLASGEVREMARQAGKPFTWICGHTHSPLDAVGLFHHEQLGASVLYSINVSCPYFTGRDFVQTEPVALYVCRLTAGALDVQIEDAETGSVLREEHLAFGSAPG